MKHILAVSIAAALFGGCTPATKPAAPFYGTTEPFAGEAIYFVVTDRFVNGDPGNDHRDQGGKWRTFDVPVPGPDGDRDNIGYLTCHSPSPCRGSSEISLRSARLDFPAPISGPLPPCPEAGRCSIGARRNRRAVLGP